MYISESFEDKELLDEARTWAASEDGQLAGTIAAYINGVLAERRRQTKSPDTAE